MQIFCAASSILVLHSALPEYSCSFTHSPTHIHQSSLWAAKRSQELNKRAEHASEYLQQISAGVRNIKCCPIWILGSNFLRNRCVLGRCRQVLNRSLLFLQDWIWVSCSSCTWSQQYYLFIRTDTFEEEPEQGDLIHNFKGPRMYLRHIVKVVFGAQSKVGRITEQPVHCSVSSHGWGSWKVRCAEIDTMQRPPPCPPPPHPTLVLSWFAQHWCGAL